MTPGELVTNRRILLCVGAGGVGKTTVSAALAMAAAAQGQRAAVVTIDPARRLADAMGLASLDNTPRLVEGEWPGELWAMMLDGKATFDELVRRHATDDDQARRILENRFYRNIVSTLSGSTEYMAVEKLFELNEQGYDLIVVDTPPSSHSLEFIAAPERIDHFVTKRLRWILRPPKVLRPVAAAITTFLRQAARIVGQDVIDDSLAFLAAFEGMEGGFAERSRAVTELLAHPATGFAVITSGRPAPTAEAMRLCAELVDAGHQVDAVIANMLHPRLASVDVEASDTPGDSAFAAIMESYRAHVATVETEDAALAPLDALSDVAQYRLGLLDRPASALDAIGRLAGELAD